VRPKPSPLVPLEQIRQEREDQRVRELGAALDEAARAEGERARAEERRAAIEREAAETRASERARLEAGGLSVADLAQGAAWAQGVRARQEEAERARREAAEAAQKAREEVGRQRLGVAAARADVDVVKRLLAHAKASREAQEIAALEEAAEDAFRARRHAERGPGGGKGV
jgi:hypothetical protein